MCIRDSVWIMSRTDDIINVAGHRLSTGAIEEVLAEHNDVAECAVIGIADNEPYKMPATIDDPAILDEIKADLIESKILKL